MKVKYFLNTSEFYFFNLYIIYYTLNILLWERVIDIKEIEIKIVLKLLKKYIRGKTNLLSEKSRKKIQFTGYNPHE